MMFLWIGLFITIVNSVGILFIIKNAKKLKLLDIPNERSSHHKAKPKGAGVVTFFSFIISLFIFKLDFIKDYYPFFISLGIVFLVGLYDDVVGVKPKIKLLFIGVATLVLYLLSDFKIDDFGNWFGYDIKLPIYLALPFTIFVVSGYTNALNLIDGLDGLAGGISFVIFLAFLYLGLTYHNSFITIVSFLYLISLLTFLVYNWYPSRIFMGDSGSLVLGFTISVLSIELIKYISITSVLFLGAMPILDTLMVMIRRIQRGKSPFKPDKTHTHHKLFSWTRRVNLSVWFMIVFQITFSLFGILVSKQNNIFNLLIFLFVVYIFLHIFDDRKTLRVKDNSIKSNK